MNKVKAILYAILAYSLFPVLNGIAVLLDCEWREFFREMNRRVRYYWRGKKN